MKEVRIEVRTKISMLRNLLMTFLKLFLGSLRENGSSTNDFYSFSINLILNSHKAYLTESETEWGQVFNIYFFLLFFCFFKFCQMSYFDLLDHLHFSI